MIFYLSFQTFSFENNLDTEHQFCYTLPDGKRGKMIRHFSDIAEIVENVDAAVGFYRNTLGLKVDHESGTGYATIEIPGILHFGVWSREQAAHNIFGENADPTKISLGFTLGFEVDLVEADTRAAGEKGLTFIQTPKTESWGQVTSRYFSPSGALCELSETPWARKITRDIEIEEEKK